MPTILHLDDEEVIRAQVKTLLAEAGFSVVSVSNITEAETLLRSHEFDLILSDSDLPNRLEGLHFVLSVREQHPDQRVAILAEKHQFRKLPFISKGILPNGRSFVNKVRQVLKSS